MVNASVGSTRRAVMAIAVGGLVAGTLDLAQALILFSTKIPLAIAGGLLGPQAFHGGTATYILGVFLHFFIALSAAAIYYAVSRTRRFLTQYPLLCGLFFGATVDLVMRLIVLPLSALHSRGPYQYSDLVRGILVHMVTVGLPISFIIRHFANLDTEPISVSREERTPQGTWNASHESTVRSARS
jgi:hypothetical protein